MENFTFNNISSSSLGLIIKEMPLVPQSEKNIESIKVNGRNGNLHIDNNNYLSKDYEVICIAKDRNKIDEICKIMIGSGKLVLSKYNDRYFNAIVKNQVSFKKYGNYLQEFPILFELDPIAYSTEETSETLTQSGSIIVGGNVDINPMIEVTGIGQVTINGYSFEVTESNITIDCELMNCTNQGISRNDKVILDEFPKLSVGNNLITLGSGINQVTIKYRKGWL